MTDPSAAGPVTDGSTARERADRRRRLAEIFGDVLPEQTADDRGSSGEGSDRTEEKAQEDWLKSQVPPHHG